MIYIAEKSIDLYKYSHYILLQLHKSDQTQAVNGPTLFAVTESSSSPENCLVISLLFLNPFTVDLLLSVICFNGQEIRQVILKFLNENYLSCFRIYLLYLLWRCDKNTMKRAAVSLLLVQRQLIIDWVWEIQQYVTLCSQCRISRK